MNAIQRLAWRWRAGRIRVTCSLCKHVAYYARDADTHRDDPHAAHRQLERLGWRSAKITGWLCTDCAARKAQELSASDESDEQSSQPQPTMRHTA